MGALGDVIDTGLDTGCTTRCFTPSCSWPCGCGPRSATKEFTDPA